MKKILLAAALSACCFGASASSFSAGLGGWTGNTNGNASSVTTGGSSSEVGTAGNGYAANYTLNAGGGTATAFGSFSSQGVTTGSNVSSFSGGVSQSVHGGNSFSEGAGAVGTDVNAGAWGNFANGGFGGFLGFGR